MEQNYKKPVGWQPSPQLLDVKDSNVFSSNTMNNVCTLFFILRAKVQCPHTGWQDSWKMLRALLCTRREKCQWWLMCSCETFQLKFSTLQPKTVTYQLKCNSWHLKMNFFYICSDELKMYRLFWVQYSKIKRSFCN